MLRSLIVLCLAGACSGLVHPAGGSPARFGRHSLAHSPPSRTATLRMQESQTVEQAVQMGRGAIDSLIGMLAEGEEPPESLRALKAACDDAADAQQINLQMYHVLIDQVKIRSSSFECEHT